MIFFPRGDFLFEIQSMERLLWCARTSAEGEWTDGNQGQRTHCAADTSHCLAIKSPPPSRNRIKTRQVFVWSSLKALLLGI